MGRRRDPSALFVTPSGPSAPVHFQTARIGPCSHRRAQPTPSEADIKITHDLIRAGQLLKIEVLDHVILGHSTHTSLRSLGYFYS
ncbi:MAG: hypothetical protein GYA76_03975 [Verrucomicrobia bacterium]|nr:hypothetical protein [Verrucomicrobiota bacterium]